MESMKKNLNPRQRKLIEQIPEIIEGKKTKKQAILDAGYKESTAREQQQVLGNIGIESVMQAALRKAQVTEDKLSEKISEGLEATRLYGQHGEIETEDYATRHKYVVTAAEFLNAFPDKNIHLKLEGLSDQEIDAKIRSTTAALAEEAISGTLGGETETQ